MKSLELVRRALLWYYQVLGVLSAGRKKMPLGMDMTTYDKLEFWWGRYKYINIVLYVRGKFCYRISGYSLRIQWISNRESIPKSHSSYDLHDLNDSHLHDGISFFFLRGRGGSTTAKKILYRITYEIYSSLEIYVMNK